GWRRVVIGKIGGRHQGRFVDTGIAPHLIACGVVNGQGDGRADAFAEPVVDDGTDRWIRRVRNFRWARFTLIGAEAQAQGRLWRVQVHRALRDRGADLAQGLDVVEDPD